MFRAKVLGSFASAHRLREYEGDCERLHGHNYKVEVSVMAEELDSIGIVMDFRELKRILNEIMDSLDHHYLNELDAFTERNPSAENIAMHIHGLFKAQLVAPVQMHEVVVWENDRSCVIYSE